MSNVEIMLLPPSCSHKLTLREYINNSGNSSLGKKGSQVYGYIILGCNSNYA